MLNVFVSSLGYLGIDSSNMSKVGHEKLIYKFEDLEVNRQWINFYSIYMNAYKTGYKDACNKIGILAVREIGEMK